MYFTVKNPRSHRKACATNYQKQAPTHKTKSNRTRPRVNIVEGDDFYRVLLAIPGIAKDAISIKVEEQTLTISSEISTALQEGEKYNHREFKVKGFTRNFTLAETADTDRIEAKVEHGILAVTIFKKAEAAKQAARTIDVG